MDHSPKSLYAHEIPNIIEKAALFGGRVTQLNPSSNLQTIIKKIDVDIYGTMTMILQEEIPLERNRPINITFNYRDLSFYLHQNQYTYEGNVIKAESPVGAKALAVRENERYILPLDEKIGSSIYRIERRGSHCQIEASIVDLSKDGLGLLIQNAEEEALIQHDHVWVKGLHHFELPTPIFARVIYATSRKFKDNVMDMRVGLALESKIPEDIYQKLKEISRLVLF